MSHVQLETESQHLVCRHCGTIQRLATPATLTAVADQMSAFATRHEACPRPDTLPKVRAPRPAPNATAAEIFAWPGLAAWLDEGARGVSSEAIVQTIAGIPLNDFGLDVPHDASDFGRCVALLNRVPALRPRLTDMAVVDARWRSLVAEWSNLEALYHGSDLDREALYRWLTANAARRKSSEAPP